MVKTLTKVGNSKAVILPAKMIIKYNFGKRVMIEETEDGILIRSVTKESSFHKGMRKLRIKKESIYRQMEAEANDPATQQYYASKENNLDDVDQTIIEE